MARIVVVDPNPALSQTLTALLSRFEDRVEWYKRQQEVMPRLENGDVDLLLIDEGASRKDVLEPLAPYLRSRRPLLVPACEQLLVQVMADFSLDALVGGRHTFHVIQSSTVVTTVPVSGEFPLAGEEFQLSVLSTGSLNVTYETITQDVEVHGNDRQVIGEFTVTADLVDDQTLYSVILENSGSAQDGDVVGITLRRADSRANLTNFVPEMYDDRISLHFDPPYVVFAGQSVTFQVTGDVVDGLRRNVRIEIDEPSDLLGVGLFGFGESGMIFGSSVILNGSPSRVNIVP